MPGGAEPYGLISILCSKQLSIARRREAAAGSSRWDRSQLRPRFAGDPRPSAGGPGSLGGPGGSPLWSRRPILRPGTEPCPAQPLRRPLVNVPPSCGSSGTSMAAQRDRNDSEKGERGRETFPGVLKKETSST